MRSNSGDRLPPLLLRTLSPFGAALLFDVSDGTPVFVPLQSSHSSLFCDSRTITAAMVLNSIMERALST